MIKLIEDYNESLQAIYDHVGFKEDWVVYPLDDRTEMYWSIDNGEVKYAETLEKYNSIGDYYVDKIYPQRFYKKWVYEGKEFTMIFCDPMVDGMKYFALFDNKYMVYQL